MPSYFKKVMKRKLLREKLLELLNNETKRRGKNIWFKSKQVSSKLGTTPREVGYVCARLAQEGILLRHGTRNPSSWGTRFKEFT